MSACFHNFPVKLALHRSVTFWSGIFVMAFICWAWRDSELQMSTVFRKEWSLSHYSSAVVLIRTKVDHSRPFLFLQHEVPHRSQVFPAPLFLSGSNHVESGRGWGRHFAARPTAREGLSFSIDEGGDDVKALMVPHWLILLSFALSWSALLLWRTRSRKRALAISE